MSWLTITPARCHTSSSGSPSDRYGRGLRISLAGTWTLRVTVRTSDIGQVTVTKTMTVNPTLP
ncbi:hypothetical protein ACWGH2_36250 [Streptomyces sp. NPDC054871]